MASFLKAASDLYEGKVVARNSWGPDKIVFKVSGFALEQSFYENYGIGERKFPIDDFLAFSNGSTVSFGWQPSSEDLIANDWVLVE
jgi:hypothetical protein